MIRETPNFTYEQELACPVCGAMAKKLYTQDRQGRYKRSTQTLKRAQSKGPWAKDDVLEEETRRVNRYESRVTGMVWVHKVELMCSKCGLSGSYGNFVPHEFADDELPFDFWDEPWGVYLPEESPNSPAPDPGDIYGLDDIF